LLTMLVKLMLNSFIYLLIISLFIGGLGIGYFFGQKNELKLSQQSRYSPSLIDSLTDTKVFPSPTGDKKIIVTGKYCDNNTKMILESSGKRENLDSVDCLVDIKWSPDESKIAISWGTTSLGLHVHILNLDNKKLTGVAAEQVYINNRSNDTGEDLTHIYTRVVDWFYQDKLMIETSGYSAASDSQAPKYYFVNPNTGKIISSIK